MKRQPAALAERRFDMVIIGAGITGACLAYDAALRGLAVALIDKGDFGGATSAASSKLLHGGIRYLQQFDFAKVRESARERLYFHNLAPHLIDWVPLIVPTYRGLAKGKLLLASGMLAYDFLCSGLDRELLDPSRRPPRGRWLSTDEIRRLIPGLRTEQMTGGRLFYESHMLSSERMTLAFVDGAARAGASVLNYVSAQAPITDGDRLGGIRVRDLETGDELDARAGVVVNAAGPWIGDLDRELGGAQTDDPVTGFSAGAHILTRPLTDGYAVALPTPRASNAVIDRGGRHVFVIPWRGRSLIGTSYSPYRGDLDAVQPTEPEIEQLIGEINRALGEGTLNRDDVGFAYAGLYPLVAREIDPNRYQGTGEYQVVDHGSRGGPRGLYTVLGAKYTTARRLAERALDRICRGLAGATACQTRRRPLPAGDLGDLEAFTARTWQAAPSSLSSEAVTHLVRSYGTDAPRLIRLLRDRPELAAPLVPQQQTRAVEVVWAAQHEMAVHLDDVVFRRTGLGTLGHPGEIALRRCADLMGNASGWDEERRRQEVERVQRRFP